MHHRHPASCCRSRRSGRVLRPSPGRHRLRALRRPARAQADAGVFLVGMGVSTVLIGLLPTYAQIGIAAPILLTLLRLAQGFAVGGEWGGATLMAVEHASTERKGVLRRLPADGRARGDRMRDAGVLPRVATARRAVPVVGLAATVPVQRRVDRHRAGDPADVVREPRLRRAARYVERGPHAHRRRRSASIGARSCWWPEAICPRAYSLHLRGLPRRIRHVGRQDRPHLGAFRRVRRRRGGCGDVPTLRIAVRPRRPQGAFPARRRPDGACRSVRCSR